MEEQDTTAQPAPEKPSIPVQRATPKQRDYLRVLLKQHRNHPDMPAWWSELKPYWVVEEIAVGVKEGRFTELLPKRTASKYIDLLTSLETPDAGFDADRWMNRAGTYWLDPATSKVVVVKVSAKTGNPYGKSANPEDGNFLFESGLLKNSLVPLTHDEFMRYTVKHPGRCPVCRGTMSSSEAETHAFRHSSKLPA